MIRMATAASACDKVGVPFPPLLRSIAGGVERLVDRVLCVAGAVAFSQAPEFMQQYLRRLEGHLDEARLQLGKFTEAAAQSGMTLAQFAANAAHNPDPALAHMGAVVQDASQRVAALASADAALRGASALSRPFVFLAHADWGIARATWAIYRPAVPTTAEGAAYALAGMAAALGLYHLAVRGPVARRLARRARPPSAPVR